MKLTREERFKTYLESITPVQSDLKKCLRVLVQELNKALQHHSKKHEDVCEYSLQMLDSCIPKMPTGSEQGLNYVVELNGSFVRTSQYKIEKKTCTLIKERQLNLRENFRTPTHPDGLLDQHTTASMLFDEIAKVFKEIIDPKDLDKQIGIGFSISFPLLQKSVNHGILKIWTKGFKTGSATHDPVVGQNVCALLENALARQKINAKVVAAINPAVGSLLAGIMESKATQRPCTVGFILGNGVNGAYIQADSEMYGYNSVIINTELGNFDKLLPRIHIDYEIDFYSGAQGRQLLEKMTSELYIGEICRLLVLQIFQHEAPLGACKPYSLSYENCFNILKDKPLFSETAEILKLHWNWELRDEAALGMIHTIITAVFERSASIAATAIAGAAMASGCLQPAMGGVTVAIDGVLYVQNPIYQTFVKKYLDIILEYETASLLTLLPVSNSSAQMAARLVSCLSEK